MDLFLPLVDHSGEPLLIDAVSKVDSSVFYELVGKQAPATAH